MSLLDIRNMSVHFGGLKALSGIDIQVEKGTMVGIIGPNGAGKTTLFNAITGVVRPVSGSILFNQKNVIGLKPHQIAKLGISRTFQNIRLFGKMTVLQNVMIGLNSTAQYSFPRGMLRLPDVRKMEKAATEQAFAYLESVHMQDYYKSIAGSLPYGLQRKLEIARAIATRPQLLLLDEPAAGMNNEETGELIQFIRQLHENSQTNMSIMIIEHHLEVVMNLCSDITVFNLGEILQQGSPEKIINSPEVISAYIGQRRQKL